MKYTLEKRLKMVANALEFLKQALIKEARAVPELVYPVLAVDALIISTQE